MLKIAGLNFISKIAGAAFNFLLIVWISNLLGPGERGICALYLLVIVIILGISEIAGGATTAYLMQKFSYSAILRWHSRWILLPAVLVPLIFHLFNTISWKELILLTMAGWLHSKWNIQQHILLALHQFRIFNVSVILAPIITLSGFGVFWRLGYASSIYYLIALIISWGFLFVINYFFINRKCPKPEHIEHPNLKDIMEPGLLNQFGHVLSLINNRFIFFIIPAVQLGLLSNALTLAEAVLMIPGSLGQIMYARLASKNNGLNPKSVFKKISILNIILITLGLLFLAILPDNTWKMVFGLEFKGLKKMLVIMLPGIGFYSFYLIISYFHSAQGKFFLNIIPLAAGLILNILGSVWLYFTNNYTLISAVWLLSFTWILISICAAVVAYIKN